MYFLRLNLFCHKIEKPSVHDVLLKESKLTNNFSIGSKSLSDAEKIKKQIHDLAEEKLRMESGDVKFFSFKKNVQFQFRIKKVEKSLEQKEPNIKMDRSFSQPNNESKNEPKFDFLVDEDLKKLKTEGGRELYKKLKKCQNEDEIKKASLNFLNNFKKKTMEELNLENSLMNQIPRFYAEDTLEFNQYFPEFSISKNFTKEQVEQLFENPENFELSEGNVFLLKKMKKITNSNIIKHWKYLQNLDNYF